MDHELRFTPMLLTARRLLREGAIGTVSAVTLLMLPASLCTAMWLVGSTVGNAAAAVVLTTAWRAVVLTTAWRATALLCTCCCQCSNSSCVDQCLTATQVMTQHVSPGRSSNLAGAVHRVRHIDATPPDLGLVLVGGCGVRWRHGGRRAHPRHRCPALHA